VLQPFARSTGVAARIPVAISMGCISAKQEKAEVEAQKGEEKEEAEMEAQKVEEKAQPLPWSWIPRPEWWNKFEAPPPPPSEEQREAFLRKVDGAWGTVVERLLRDSPPNIKGDKQCVLAAVSKCGMALHYADETLKSDKQVVLAAVTQDGRALKFALNGLNQDPDCLKAAGLFDEEKDKVYERDEKVTLSVKFSLAEQSSPYATEFAKGMKEDDYLKKFKTYNPNAWCKDSCDENFTDINHPCRGTSSTCGIHHKNLDPGTQRPCSTSCWRFAFRFHQEESKESRGFMIQVEEKGGLGDGQKIETEMAREVNLKVFRTYTNIDFYPGGDSMVKISKAVKEWYDGDCANMDLENVFIGAPFGNPYTERPKYGKL